MPTKAPQTADVAPKNIMPIHQKEIPHPTPQKILHSLLFVITYSCLSSSMIKLYHGFVCLSSINFVNLNFYNNRGRLEKLVATNWVIKKKPTISVGAWDLEGRFLLQCVSEDPLVWFRIPDPPFKPLGGLGAHLNPFGSRGSSPRIPQSIPLSPCGGFIGSVLRTLVGHTLCGLCLASTCALIISPIGSAVKGFLKISSEVCQRYRGDRAYCNLTSV